MRLSGLNKNTREVFSLKTKKATKLNHGKAISKAKAKGAVINKHFFKKLAKKK